MWLKPTGPEAIEPLLAALKREPRPKQEPSDVAFIRNAAAEALASVGKGAETAVPALVEMLTKAKKEDVEAMARPQKPGETGRTCPARCSPCGGSASRPRRRSSRF